MLGYGKDKFAVEENLELLRQAPVISGLQAELTAEPKLEYSELVYRPAYAHIGSVRDSRFLDGMRLVKKRNSEKN